MYNVLYFITNFKNHNTLYFRTRGVCHLERKIKKEKRKKNSNIEISLSFIYSQKYTSDSHNLYNKIVVTPMKFTLRIF